MTYQPPGQLTPPEPSAPAQPASPPLPPPPPAAYGTAPWGVYPVPQRHTARNVGLAIAGVIAVLFVVVVVLTVVGRSTGSPAGTLTTAYTDPHTRWSATFSGTPAYHETTEPSGAGPIPYLYAEYAGFDVDQVVGVLLLPAGSTFDLQRGIDGLASSEGGTVTSSTPGTFQGFTSLEAVINLGGSRGVLKCQTVKVGDVLYIFGTSGPVNPPSDYASFIASVHLTPH